MTAFDVLNPNGSIIDGRMILANNKAVFFDIKGFGFHAHKMRKILQDRLEEALTGKRVLIEGAWDVSMKSSAGIAGFRRLLETRARSARFGCGEARSLGVSHSGPEARHRLVALGRSPCSCKREQSLPVALCGPIHAKWSLHVGVRDPPVVQPRRVAPEFCWICRQIRERTCEARVMLSLIGAKSAGS